MDGSTPDAQSYQVGWICAVRTEYIVACELLDEEYNVPSHHSSDDNNIYTCGRMESFLVVIACLPKGKYGLTSAATVAQDLRHSFPSLKFGLMVGIGGGAPTKDHDIRLGDVVVSSPTGRTGGVIHYEFGATMQNKCFSPVGHLNSPPRVLLTAVQQLDTLHYRRGHKIDSTIAETLRRNPRLKTHYSRPTIESDILFKSSYLHQDHSRSCAQCCHSDGDTTIARPSRSQADSSNEGNTIQIHYGLIASADRMMKDATVRDRLAESEGILCFEMEAAGLMESFPCLVIRGICDYSDTHKNDIWQGYAAATAGAYAKELLAILPKRDLGKRSTKSETSGEEEQPNIGKKLYPKKNDTTELLRKDTWTISTLQKMGFKDDQNLPNSFILAINNTLSVADIERFIAPTAPETSLNFPYFVAGSFMFPSTIRAINDNISLEDIVSKMTPATLRGYDRHGVKGASWPALYPSNNRTNTVAGMAIFGLTSKQKESLHRFQNEHYDLEPTTIIIETSQGPVVTSAAVYVWNGFWHRLIPHDQVTWDPMNMVQGEWLQQIFRSADARELALNATRDPSAARAEKNPSANSNRPDRHVGNARRMEAEIKKYKKVLSGSSYRNTELN